MNFLESIRIALDVLGANKLRSGLTMLGIVIGVFAVISLVSLGRGVQQYVTDQFAGMGSNLLLVTPGKRETTGAGQGPMIGANNVKKLTLSDMETVQRRVFSVNGACPIVFGLGLVKYEGRSRNTMLIGTNEEFPDVRNIQPAVGGFPSQEDVDGNRRVASIGTLVKQELFGSENPLGKYISVMGTPFRVIGVMEHRGQSLGFDLDDLVFVPVTSAMKLFNTDSLVEILFRARSAAMMDEAKEEVKAVIKERHNGEEDITIVTQNQMLSTLDTILGALTASLGGIAAISLIVGGIGIMNIMLVSVRERTREIGLRKAVGARSRDILIQFLVESVVLSLIGGILGILLAVSLQFIARLAIPALPVMLTPWAVGLAVTFSAAIGIFFGVVPARRASRLNPIEALRTE